MKKFIYWLIDGFIRNWFVLLNKSRFRSFGHGSRIYKPIIVEGFENISIGDNVIIKTGAWLTANALTGSSSNLVIGDGSCLGNHSHIYATQSIEIGEDVLTADNVYISDNLHSYEDVSIPIIKQPIKQCNPVVIGDGCWIGEHVCIIGSSIGKHCVIGANSVVTHDIPDYSVAVGVPARVIKRYDFEAGEWVKT